MKKTIKKIIIIFLIYVYIQLFICLININAVGPTYYIGTVGTGDNITLSSGIGYNFYSDLDCLNTTNGRKTINTENSESLVLYVKANENYQIFKIEIINESNNSNSITPNELNGIWTLSFDSTITDNQLIRVTTAVYGNGGTISSDSTASYIASLFDNSYIYNSSNIQNTIQTNNLFVIKNNSEFTITLTNNILQNDTFVISGNTSLNIVSSGDYMIKRNFGYGVSTSYMFNLPNNNSTLSMGSGSIENNNITYYYSDNTQETISIDTNPNVPNDAYVLYTEVNTIITNTMLGKLTIDGGAILNAYTGTQYSFQDASRATGNIIKLSNGGIVNIWDGVIIQNNLVNGNDNQGGVAINVSKGSLNVYGGIIRSCVNCCTRIGNVGVTGSSFGDGGAILLTSSNTIATIYDIEIYNCESDNSSAISLWTNSKMYFINGSIHNNFAYGDTSYPAQAFSVYDSGVLYVYGGAVFDNDGVNFPADMRISSSGSNVLFLYGGTIERLGSNADTNTINIYNGQVLSFVGINDDASFGGTVNYSGETPYTITLLNSVNEIGSDCVMVEIHDMINNRIVNRFETYGFGNSSVPNKDLNVLIRPGTYQIFVYSTSMTKKYSLTIIDSSCSINAIDRIVTKPSIENKSNSMVSFKMVGVGNVVDGSIYYGISSTTNVNDITWQSSNVFNDISGTKFFYIKANAVTDSFSESISEALKIDLPLVNSVILNINNVSIAKGSSYSFSASIIGENEPSQEVVWSISGNNDPSTRIYTTGVFSVSQDETTSIIYVRATSIADGTKYAIATVTVVDPQIVSSDPTLSRIDFYANSINYGHVNVFDYVNNVYNATMVILLEYSTSVTISPVSSTPGLTFEMFINNIDITNSASYHINNYFNDLLVINTVAEDGNTTAVYNITIVYYSVNTKTNSTRYLNEITSSNSSVITSTSIGEYTCQFLINHLSNDDNPLSVKFSQIIPVGTKLTLIDIGDSQLTYYYYILNSASTELLLSSFIKMGTNDGFIMEEGRKIKKLSIAVDFPQISNVTSHTMKLMQGSTEISSIAIAINNSDTTFVNISTGTITTEKNSVTVPVNYMVTNNGNENKVIVITLLKEDNTVCTFPVGSFIQLDNNQPSYIGENIAIFNLGNCQLTSVPSTLLINGLSINQSYKIKIDLCITNNLSNPLNESISSIQTTAILIDSFLEYTLKVNQTDTIGKVITSLSETQKLLFDLIYNVPNNVTPSFNAIIEKKNGSLYTNSSWAVTLPNTSTPIKAEVIVPSNVTTGTYRITFTLSNNVDTISVVYYIIVN